MILFIDIETVPIYPNLEDYSKEIQELWLQKSSYLKLSNLEQENQQLGFINNAGLHAEWSKIICIGIGYVNQADKKLHLKAITAPTEKDLLEKFTEIVRSFSKTIAIQFCGHNIKEFDLPFICRRLLINDLEIPQPLDISGLKPWENNHIDTMQLWKFGDYKHYTSLKLLALTLGITVPETGLDGSKIASEYYEQKNINNIVNYCLQDVTTAAKVYFKIKSKQLPFHEELVVEV